ncbi:MAG TPA: SPOR domain-containing protein, partial [Burkholderiaceae bacterium]|nr:SPOR domain-containing protein [Burkholderiaceae bacterium]
MGLLSVFKRSDPPPAAGADTADAVQRARTLARQRLIGAAVLVVIGVIGFPLVFETQPRPIPVDIPIEVPRKDGAPPLVMPPARGTAPTAASSSDARVATGTVPPAPAPREEPAPEPRTEPVRKPADTA